MNETLIKEFKKHFAESKGKAKFVENQFDRLAFDSFDYEHRIEQKLHTIAIKLLKAKNFEFNSDGSSDGTRFYDRWLAKIVPNSNGNRIKVRAYKHKYWNSVYFLSEHGYKHGLYEVLPNGFKEGVNQILNMIKETEKYNNKFKKTVDIDDIKVSYIDDEEVITVTVDNISISTDICIRNKEDKYMYDSDKEQFYNNDKIFETVKKLLVDRKEAIKDNHVLFCKSYEDIFDFIENKFDMILVKTRLMEQM